MVRHASFGIHVKLNTGENSFGDWRQWAGNYDGWWDQGYANRYGAGFSQSIQFNDLTGDGLPEIIQCYSIGCGNPENGDFNSTRIFINKADGLELADSQWDLPYVRAGFAFFRDVTGDGLGDAILFKDQKVVVYPSNGNGFEDGQEWMDYSRDGDQTGTNNKVVEFYAINANGEQITKVFNTNQMFFTDLNNDGCNDLVANSEDTYISFSSCTEDGGFTQQNKKDIHKFDFPSFFF